VKNNVSVNIFFAVIVTAILILLGQSHANAENKLNLKNCFLHEDTLPVTTKNVLQGPCYTIYLTFDDGPVKESEELFRIATKDSVPINVFVVGEKVFANDTMKRLFQSYFNNPFVEIGNHSFTHAHKKYQEYYKDIERVIEDFKVNADSLHLTEKIARLPGRNTWRIDNKSRTDLPDANAAADSLAAAGYSIFGWDLEWRYCSDSCLEVQTAESMVKEIENSFRNRKTFTPGNIIILAHDPMFGSSYNKEQLELFIKEIKKKHNFRFGRLDNY
jgi:peptidoglycan/xylan/chitin deacetylase (PgdA/CDA1 family)